jgi:hypothetical protein
VWKGDKVPYQPKSHHLKAKANDPITWGTYKEAVAAYDTGEFSGVGFVLNGDGIAGVDIDNCIIDGEISAEALALINEIGCSYVEYSPGGKGLRSFGFASDRKGRRGTLQNTNIELYTSKRYLTVTGHVFKKGPLIQLSGYEEVFSRIASSKATEGPEVTECNSSVSSDSFVSSASSASSVAIPAGLIPTGEGQRNRKVFDLARYLKGLHPDLSFDELRPMVKDWFTLAEPQISTKEFSLSWIEFRVAWEAIKTPYGSVLAGIVANLPPPKEDAVWLEYGPHASNLFQLCLALQEREGESPFFISSRTAGKFLGIHHTMAAKILKILVIDGVLEEVSKGSINALASRYRVKLKLPE